MNEKLAAERARKEARQQAAAHARNEKLRKDLEAYAKKQAGKKT